MGIRKFTWKHILERFRESDYRTEKLSLTPVIPQYEDEVRIEWVRSEKPVQLKTISDIDSSCRWRMDHQTPNSEQFLRLGCTTTKFVLCIVVVWIVSKTQSPTSTTILLPPTMELQSATLRPNCVRQIGHRRQIVQRPKRYGRGIRIRVFIILLLSLTLFAASTSLLQVKATSSLLYVIIIELTFVMLQIP